MGHMLFTPATTIQFWSRPSSSVEKYVLHQWLMYAKTTVMMMMASIDLLWPISIASSILQVQNFKRCPILKLEIQQLSSSSPWNKWTRNLRIVLMFGFLLYYKAFFDSVLWLFICHHCTNSLCYPTSALGKKLLIMLICFSTAAARDVEFRPNNFEEQSLQLSF